MKVGDCAEPSLDDSPPEADRDHDAEGRVARIPAPVERAHHDAFKFWYICVVQPRRGGGGCSPRYQPKYNLRTTVIFVPHQPICNQLFPHKAG